MIAHQITDLDLIGLGSAADPGRPSSRGAVRSPGKFCATRRQGFTGNCAIGARGEEESRSVGL
jgi:hypothetical protein